MIDQMSEAGVRVVYLEMIQTTAGMALAEIEKDRPIAPDREPCTAFRHLTAMLLKGYPHNLKFSGTPKFNLFTSYISGEKWIELAVATGFIEYWPNGTRKTVELILMHLETHCIMALDTLAMYFENGQPDIVQEKEKGDAVQFCRAICDLQITV